MMEPKSKVAAAIRQMCVALSPEGESLGEAGGENTFKLSRKERKALAKEQAEAAKQAASAPVTPMAPAAMVDDEHPDNGLELDFGDDTAAA
jgi:hypothetical protein